MEFSLMMMYFSGHILFLGFTWSLVLNTLFKPISHTGVYTYTVPVQVVTFSKNTFMWLTLYNTWNLSCVVQMGGCRMKSV